MLHFETDEDSWIETFCKRLFLCCGKKVQKHITFELFKLGNDIVLDNFITVVSDFIVMYKLIYT